MSFIITQLPCELPVFKDKVMYINPSDSAYKMEQSYVISASYKGILRLSPNNYNTVYETNPIELTVKDDQSITFSYSDAIVFDDKAIVEPGEETEAKKVNADIRYRMIIGSDSDGYLVNFRMSDESVEFDKLGVIGITKTKKLTLYTDADFSNPKAFTLGNTIMPSLPNELDSSEAALENELANISGNTKVKTYDWDEIEIDITGDGDQSYMLYGYPNKEGKRVFDYRRSQQFIRDIIMEALLSIKSVPTGSIHWLPVTYEQYAILVNDGKQYPNHYFRKDDTGNNTTTAADPIIRDYLLCDGRKHKSSHFPELAKILWGEKINYWDYNGKMQTHINGGHTKVNKEENGITTSTKQYDEYFRVPDLRGKFISYVYAKGVEDALYLEPEQIHKWMDDEYKTNVTGYYTPDNSPRYPSGHAGATHFHFSAYGTYNGYNMRCARNNDTYQFTGFKFDTDLSDLSDLGSPRIWYLQNTVGDHSSDGNSDSDQGNTQPGWAYGFGSAGPRRRKCSTNDIIPANAYASAPEGGHAAHVPEPNKGNSSFSKSIYKIPSSNSETYKVTKYENITDEDIPFDYIDLESGITKNQTNKMTSRYGYENAPKFYAFLPLIKI